MALFIVHFYFLIIKGLAGPTNIVSFLKPKYFNFNDLTKKIKILYNSNCDSWCDGWRRYRICRALGRLMS